MVTLRKPGATPICSGYNVNDPACPTRMVLDRIGDKWALLVLDKLRQGTARFNVIKRDVGGISQKVLSQVLKNLERDGLLNRLAHPTVPVTVEYSLTELGETLIQAVTYLTHWAEANMPDIQQAQSRYDLKQSEAAQN